MIVALARKLLIRTGQGLKEAIVMEFFETSEGNLLPAEEAAGVRHHVALSIVDGIDAGIGRGGDDLMVALAQNGDGLLSAAKSRPVTAAVAPSVSAASEPGSPSGTEYSPLLRS